MVRRLFLSLLLALSIGCAGVVKPVVEILRPSYLSSIEPVQYLIEGGQGLRNGCTASSINRAEQLWITAAHCWVPDQTYIHASPAELVEGYSDIDVAVLKVPGYTSGGELYRSDKRPNFETPITIAGHPFGYQDVFVTKGWIANPSAMLSEATSGYKYLIKLPRLSETVQAYNGFMLFNTTAAPGNSGSPVLDANGDVVSILQIGWGRTFSPVSGGATYEALKWFDRYFAKKQVKGASK